MLKNKKIKIGVIGCGKIATNHFNAIKELSEELDLAAICDNHLESLKQNQEKLQTNGYQSISEMLKAVPDIDVVSLCSPSGLHAQQAIEIAAFGKHVITEKPMATRWSDGIHMVNACDQANVKLFVVKQNRYQPVLQLLKKAISEGRFGRIYLVNLNVFWTRPQAYYEQAKWRGTWEFDGGAFMNQASHYVDLLVWLIGSVQSVQAMMSTLAIQNIETEDTGVLNLRWRNGTLGSMNVTMLTYPKNLEASLTILGEKGSVKIGGLSANTIEHWEFATPHEDDELAKQFTNETSKIPHAGHKSYYQNVIKTLHGKASPDTDGREGLRSLEVLIAAYLSARDNKSVNLPLVY